MLEALTREIASSGRELSVEEVGLAVSGLVSETVDVETKAAFLEALSARGERPGEIAGFARLLRELAVPMPVDAGTRGRGILDVCGTGGDGQNTINISTTVAILAASAGVPVAKHGNRAITSKSGSADVLEALGVPIELEPGAAAASLRDKDFVFLFAPRFHPAFRHIGPARRLCASRGRRTIFNFLGPLLNPARPDYQLVGVSQPALCEPVARVLQQLGLRRAMVVCGEAGGGFLDELSTVGETTIAEFHHERGFSVQRIAPGELGLRPAVVADLAGGDREANAVWLRRLLAGEERGARRDAVLLNAGAALFVSGRARSITEGMEFAGALIDGGKASAKLGELSTASPVPGA